MTRRLKNWQREVWAYEVSAASDRSGADHRAGLCIDLGEPEPIRQESRRRALSYRACGPRNFMKIAQSRSQNRRGSERRDRSLSGEVEAVYLSDPERAWLSE